MHSPQAVSGTVEVRVEPGKKIDHLGIKIELLGQTGALLGRAPIKKKTGDSMSVA
jgi:hypothetical protein